MRTPRKDALVFITIFVLMPLAYIGFLVGFVVLSKYIFTPLGRTGFYEAQYILDANVPAFGSLNDAGRSDRVELLETDAYGRTLFRHRVRVGERTDDWQIDTYLTTLVICQKKDEQMAYYYPDFCWLGKLSEQSGTYAEFTEEEIALIKERNDWDKPLENERMQSVLYDGRLYKDIQAYWHPLTGATGREYTALQALVCNYLDLHYDVDANFRYKYLEENASGLRAVWVSIDGQQYFCLLNVSKKTIQACEPYDGDILTCQEALHKFKEENGFYDRRPTVAPSYCEIQGMLQDAAA